MNLAEKVDIADLTWEQKEKVLRYLFAKMNDGSRGYDFSHKSSKVSLTTKGSEAPRSVCPCVSTQISVSLC